MYNLISTAVGEDLPSDRQIDGKNIIPLLKGDVNVSPHEFMFHYCGNRIQAARYRPRGGKYINFDVFFLLNLESIRQNFRTVLEDSLLINCYIGTIRIVSEEKRTNIVK